MCERYIIKDRWIFDTKLNKNIHSIDCYEEKSVLDIMNGQNERIAELEEQLKNCIKPKFNRQEHIYCVAFGEIREFVVVAYLDNNITLCEDTTTSKLEWCDNKFLVLTKEEAEAKLKELEEQDVTNN